MALKQVAEAQRQKTVARKATASALRSIRRSPQGQALLRNLERRTRSGLVGELFGEEKRSSEDPRVLHFIKIAQRMGLGSPAGTGAMSGASDPVSSFDFPPPDHKGRGAGDFTPPRPKKPGMPVRRQATNPRMRLLDAMNKGVA